VLNDGIVYILLNLFGTDIYHLSNLFAILFGFIDILGSNIFRSGVVGIRFLQDVIQTVED
jgi:hypothetical protein